MKKIILITILLAGLFTAKNVWAGVIMRPMLYSGLVAYWDFQEGSGGTAYDKSGNENNGTLTNMDPSTDWINGKLGQALDFDGTDDRIESTDISDLTSYTLSLWIKKTGYTAVGDYYQHIIDKGTGSSETGGFALIVDSSERVQLWNGDGVAPSPSFITTESLSLNQWYHLVGVWNGLTGTGSMKIYINGVSKSGAESNFGTVMLNNDYTVEIGGDQSLSSEYFFKGTIDDVRVYNRALSAEEVGRLYKLGQTKIKAPTINGLVGYWSFNEGSGTRVGDMSGNGNNGAWVGAGSHWTQGKYGTAGNFNGTDDYVDLGNTSAIKPTSAITVSLWAYHSAWSSANEMPMSCTQSAGYEFWVDGNGSGNLKWYIYRNGQYGISSTSVGGLTGWHHIIGTYDGRYTRLYLDGILKDTNDALGTYLISYVSNNVLLGAEASAGASPDAGYYWEGKIDEVRVYNRALSSDEIQTLYQSGLTKINASTVGKLTDGLVGHWTFDGPEMNATQALDASGQNNHGALVGPTRVIGKLGQALEFDGLTNRIQIPSFDVTGAGMTITAWVYLNEFGINDGYDQDLIIRKGNSYPSALVWFLQIEGRKVEFSHNAVDASGAGNQVYGLTNLQTNTWYHAAGSFDGTTMRVYLNGIQDNSKTATQSSIAAGVNNINIGARSDNLDTFKGKIDDVRVYNRALSADEVERLYNLGR